MQIGTIKQIWRYPVKSLGGEQVDNAFVQAEGIPDDRCWTIRDDTTGEIVGGRKIPGLMMLSARYVGTDQQHFDQAVRGELEILFPDGQTVRSDDPYVSAMLSMYLGRRVSLIRRPTRKEKSAYRLAKTMTPAEVRYALGMKLDDPDPDFSSFSLSMLTTLSRYATPPGVLYDVYPLHFMTTASLDWISQFYPEGDFSVRRYRPNFLIESDPDLKGIVENDWRGRKLQIGSLEILCNHPTIRCSMPGAAQPGLPKDPNIPLTLMKHAGQHLGAYASPVNESQINMGDKVELLPQTQSKLYSWFDEVGRRTKAKVLQANNWAGNLLDKQQPIAAVKSVPSGFSFYTVSRKQKESDDVMSVWLRPSNGSGAPRFMPGQHVVLAFKQKDDTYTFRPYSISSGACELGQYRLSVKLKRESDSLSGVFGIASGYIHHQLNEGDRILVKGPSGQFAIRPSDPAPLIMISAGVGITPFLSILNTLAEENSSRPINLFHGIRSLSHFPFKGEIDLLKTRLPNLTTHIYLSQPADTRTAEQFLNGRICPDEVSKVVVANEGCTVMVCGTPNFSHEMIKSLSAAGIEPGRIYSESFGPPKTRTDRDNKAYKITFSKSGQQAQWSAASESLLSLAESMGISASSGCRYGACQACEVTLTAGEVVYPEGIQAPAGKNRILLCSALPASDLDITL